MTDITEQLAVWEKQGNEIASELQSRLAELERERDQIITLLRKLKQTPGKNGSTRTDSSERRGPGILGSLCTTILAVLQEAGPEGMTSREVYEAAIAELGHTVKRTSVATQLNRCKKMGRIQAVTEDVDNDGTGFRYIFVSKKPNKNIVTTAQ